MQRKNFLKKSSIRNAEYYDMIEVLDTLYDESVRGKIFTNLIDYIIDDNNIMMAYRNLKNNSGSKTPGVDGLTFDDLKRMPEDSLLCKVKNKILNYQPKAVKRVYIPKANGKKRPLGIPTVLDRIVQQSVLQIMEPICEAKFYEKSYGFRPNRSTKNAVAMCYKLAQREGYHYVVDVDIKGFFDNVNHSKLLKQIWTLGIRDKNLLSLIKKMLKAPIAENKVRTIPEKGTPQGGVLSPLLANIVLNELDWWIASQWECMTMRNPNKSDIRVRKDGHTDRGHLYERLRKTRLKECRLVRYADDFKIFCKSYQDAVKVKCATEKWLSDRLELETSKEKSRITNLEKNYSDFLGVKFKLYQKGNRWVIKSHMCDKALEVQKNNLKSSVKEAFKSHKCESDQHKNIIKYNQKIVGIHNYYSMATMICEDVHKLYMTVDKTIKNIIHYQSYSKEPPQKLKGGMDEFFFDRYKESEQIRYLNGMVVVPIAYCKFQIPLCHSSKINRYTSDGRSFIHKMLMKKDYGDVLIKLSRDKLLNESMEFLDNRLSRFVACKGKCELTKQPLLFDEVCCHRLNPSPNLDADDYKNLRIVHVNVQKLILANDVSEISCLINKVGRNNLKSNQLRKLNEWRKKINNFEIKLADY